MMNPRRWNLAHDRFLDLGQAAVLMGILNVTPDSFSDGGRFLDQPRNNRLARPRMPGHRRCRIFRKLLQPMAAKAPATVLCKRGGRRHGERHQTVEVEAKVDECLVRLPPPPFPLSRSLTLNSIDQNAGSSLGLSAPVPQVPLSPFLSEHC